MLDKADKLIAELGKSPIIELVGVVGPNGAGRVHFPDQGWFLTFRLSAWKKVDGELLTQELTIRKPVSHDELKSVMKQFAPYERLHLQVRVAMENCLGTPQGLLVNIVRKGFSDADLDRYVSELQKPVVLRDKKLGEFILDRRTGWFEGQVEWGSSRIKLHLESNQQNNLEECLKTAHTLYDAQDAWEKRAGEMAVAKLLPTKNRSWLLENEASLSAEQFLSRIQLESITAAPGNFEFWYQDGDLFWGHAIRVSGTLAEGFTNAGIEG